MKKIHLFKACTLYQKAPYPEMGGYFIMKNSFGDLILILSERKRNSETLEHWARAQNRAHFRSGVFTLMLKMFN